LPDEKVRVEGLASFLREIKAIDAELPKAVQKANKDIAELIAGKTASAFSGGIGAAPKVAATVKAFAQQRQAGVQFGGGLPYAMGVEFGSEQYSQFQPWRGNAGNAGYYLYPTIRANRDEIVDHVERAINEVTRFAFPR
jgi:hypothetical protein